MTQLNIKKLDVIDGIQQYDFQNNDEKEPSLNRVKAHFLHGNGFHSSTLFPLANHLAEDSHFLFSDLPGHGGSFKPDMNTMPNWPLMAEQIGRVLESQIDKPIVGIGHSFGGTLSLYMALKFPHLFKQLVLMDPIMFTPSTITLLKVMRMLGLWRHTKLVSKTQSKQQIWKNKAEFKEYLSSKRLYKHWDAQVLELFSEYAVSENEQKQMQLCCNPKWEADIFGSYPKKLWQIVNKLTIPTMIIQPKHSFPFVPQAIELANKRNANIKLVSFGQTHCFPMEQPKETAVMLQKWCSFKK